MPSSVPVGIPSKIKEECDNGTSSASSGTTELASSFASSAVQGAGSVLRHSANHELHAAHGVFPARTASMSHAVDVKRGLAANRQRQMQQRLARASGERQMKRTHSVSLPLTVVQHKLIQSLSSFQSQSCTHVKQLKSACPSAPPAGPCRRIRLSATKAKWALLIRCRMLQDLNTTS